MKQTRILQTNVVVHAITLYENTIPEYCSVVASVVLHAIRTYTFLEHHIMGWGRKRDDSILR